MENWRDDIEFKKLNLVHKLKTPDKEFRDQALGLSPDFKKLLNELMMEVHVKTHKIKQIQELRT